MTLWEQLNWIDLCLILALVGCLLVGFGMGFYRQLTVAGSLLVGFVVASRLSGRLAASEWFEGVHAELGQSGAEGVAYGTIVLSALLVGLIAMLIFRSFFGKTLRFLDSVLGGAVGVAVGCLLFGLFALGVYHFEDSQFHRPIQRSILGSQIADGVRVATRIFPEELRDRIRDRITRAALPDDSDPDDSGPREPNASVEAGLAPDSIPRDVRDEATEPR